LLELADEAWARAESHTFNKNIYRDLADWMLCATSIAVTAKTFLEYMPAGI